MQSHRDFFARTAAVLIVLSILGAVTAAVTGVNGLGWPLPKTISPASLLDPVYRPVVPVQSDLGIGRLVGSVPFQSEEACLEYLRDPQFAEMLKDIVAHLNVRGLRLTGEPRCDKFDPPGTPA